MSIAAFTHIPPSRHWRISPLLVAIALSSASVYAQGRRAALEEIIVTAQKTESALQDAPLAISALNAGQLEEQNIQSISDLQGGAVPSLSVRPFSGRPSSQVIVMRGLTPSDPGQIARDPTVGIYVDGVYLGRSQGLTTDQLDLERMEILRGPQGTLFGRNALGGAVSMVSKKPTGDLGFEQTLGIGNYDAKKALTRINLPRTAGVAVKLDYQKSTRDGWLDNPAPGQHDYNEYDHEGWRAAFNWQPLDLLTLDYTYDWSRSEDVGGYQNIDHLFPGAPALAPYFSVEPHRVTHARTGGYVQPDVGEVYGHTLQAEWEATDNLTIKSISAYRELEQTQTASQIGSFYAYRPNARFGRISLAEVNQHQTSQEFQFIGDYDQVEFVAGLYYFNEKANDEQSDPVGNQHTANGPIMLPALFYSSPPPTRAAAVDATSKAIFGQATWTPEALDRRLHLTLGMRYTDDEKTTKRRSVNGAPAPLQSTFSSDRFDPAVTASYDLDDDVNVYARWSTAYRAGGVNTRSPNFAPFDEEELESFELGVKSEWLDRRLRLNAAAYWSELRDPQVDFSYITVTSPSNINTLNGAHSRDINGVELDVTAAPIEGLTLNLSYAYTDAEAPLQPNPFSGNQLTVFRISQTPLHAAAFSVNYEFAPLPVGVLAANLGVNWSDSFYPYTNSVYQTPEAHTVNARLTWSDIAVSEHGRLKVALWSSNLTDEENISTQIDGIVGPGLINAMLIQYDTPRTFGLDVTYQYR